MKHILQRIATILCLTIFLSAGMASAKLSRVPLTDMTPEQLVSVSNQRSGITDLSQSLPEVKFKIADKNPNNPMNAILYANVHREQDGVAINIFTDTQGHVTSILVKDLAPDRKIAKRCFSMFITGLGYSRVKTPQFVDKVIASGDNGACLRDQNVNRNIIAIHRIESGCDTFFLIASLPPNAQTQNAQ